MVRRKRLRRLNSDPYRYQKIGVWKIHKWKGIALLADDMGLGKTFQVLLYMRIFLDEGPFVVVCPATAKWVWWQQAAEHVGMRVEILERRTPPKNLTALSVDPKNTIYVVNYDILGSAFGRTRTWCKFLRKLKPTLVVADEGQYICNTTAKRTINFRDLSRKCKHRIITTGTPMDDNPSQLWSLLNILRPSMFPAYMPFVKRYCRVSLTPWGPKIVGGRRLKELNKVLRKTCMIRRRTEQVVKDLPPKTRVIVPIDLPDIKTYKEAERDLIAWLRATEKYRGASSRRMERMSKVMFLKHLVGQLKVKAVKNWIDDFLSGTDEKLVVFGHHRDVLGPLHETYKNSVKIDGSIVREKRMNAITKFLNDDNCRLCFGNLKAAGSAWSAKGVTKSLFIELWWKPGVHAQAEKRTHGIGRGRKGETSTSYYLIAKNTIEERLLSILQERQEITDKTLDGKVLDDTFDAFDQLEKSLLGGI